MSIREEVLIDLFERMVEHMEHGLDRDAAFLRAALELEHDLLAIAARERQALLEQHDVTVH